MTGVETVLLRVAGTAAGTLVKSLLARAPGAGLAADPARPAPHWRRPPAELGVLGAELFPPGRLRWMS
ncbi:hypothetical protein [Streptomyces sp. NPDC005533]|uniref:hypothetical protein n=1 Tax=Streptomyces sp. NPDC005533 TaxID=3364723 RepID=UPI0036CE683E